MRVSQVAFRACPGMAGPPSPLRSRCAGNRRRHAVLVLFSPGRKL